MITIGHFTYMKKREGRGVPGPRTRCEILISLWEGFLGRGLSLQIPVGTIRPGSVTKWVEIVKLGMGRQDQKLIPIFICHFNLFFNQLPLILSFRKRVSYKTQKSLFCHV